MKRAMIRSSSSNDKYPHDRMVVEEAEYEDGVFVKVSNEHGMFVDPVELVKALAKCCPTQQEAMLKALQGLGIPEIGECYLSRYGDRFLRIAEGIALNAQGEVFDCPFLEPYGRKVLDPQPTNAVRWVLGLE